jgi:translation initiation factor IF-2
MYVSTKSSNKMSAITEIENSRIKEFKEKLKKFYDVQVNLGKTPIEIKNIIINLLEIKDYEDWIKRKEEREKKSEDDGRGEFNIKY